MIYLLLSVFSSISLLILFKNFDKYRLSFLHVISINYTVASILSWIYGGLTIDQIPQFSIQVFLSLILGICFFVVFNFCAKSTIESGVGNTSMAMKMALIFPLLIGNFVYHEKNSIKQILGIFLGLVSLYLLVYESGKIEKIWYPIIVWFGSGVCDSIVQFLSVSYSDFANSGYFTFFTFGGAAISSLLYLAFSKQFRFSRNEMIGGLFLGIPNYFSIFFLVGGIKYFINKGLLSSSIFIAINNLCIVIASIVVGIFIYKEPVTKRRVIGFSIAIISILLLIKMI